MASRDLQLNGDSPYLSELFAEKTSLMSESSSNFKHSKVLLAQEIDRVTTGSKKMIDLHVSKPMKLEVKVRLPVKEYPNFNFMGKIIGQNANTLKQMQIETGTKMIIQGAGSLKDKSKEEELRKEGGKYAHLHEELHILIEAFGSASECYYKVSLALGRLNELFMMENIGDGGRMIPGRGGPMAPHRPHHARGPPANPNPSASWQSGNPRPPRPGPATTPKSTSQSTHHHYTSSSSSVSNNVGNSGVTNNNSNHHHHSSGSASSNAYSLSSAFPNHGNDIPSYLSSDYPFQHSDAMYSMATERYKVALAAAAAAVEADDVYSSSSHYPPTTTSISSTASYFATSNISTIKSGRIHSNIKYHPYKKSHHK